MQRHHTRNTHEDILDKGGNKKVYLCVSVCDECEHMSI